MSIQVHQLTKEFRLGEHASLKRTFLNLLKRFSFRPVADQNRFKALNDISFSVSSGEVVGIIGTNGAGKSTLFKVLAGITQPTSGTIQVDGSIAPLIEVGAGMHPELTGKENIYLNSAIMGVPLSRIKSRIDDIVSFSELENFIDTPIKRYSSGMRIRLGFSIAIHVDADIMIFDEILSVGDIAFQRKCFDAIEKIIQEKGKTILIVHHNIRQIERICDRVILLQEGSLVMDGSPEEVCEHYYELMDEKIKRKSSRFNREVKTNEMDLIDAEILGEDGEKCQTVNYLGGVSFRFRIRANKALRTPVFAIGFHTTDFVYIATERWMRLFTEGQDLDIGEYILECNVKEIFFLPGVYCIRFIVETGPYSKMVYGVENLINFRVVRSRAQSDSFKSEGFFRVKTQWRSLPAYSEMKCSDNDFSKITDGDK